MGRPKKPVYTASEDYLSFTEELIHSYPSIKEYCLRYEQSHKGLLEKLSLQEVYASERYGYDEPFIQYSAAEGREKDALEEYFWSRNHRKVRSFQWRGMLFPNGLFAGKSRGRLLISRGVSRGILSGKPMHCLDEMIKNGGSDVII